VEQFDRRADSYDRGRLGDWHRLIAERTADLAMTERHLPRRILDVGCGTGVLLARLAVRMPEAELLAGVDPSPRMVERSRAALVSAPRIVIEQAPAEELPFERGAFDLVVSTLSFDHWQDQHRGLVECARVVGADGRLVFADLFAAWLGPTTLFGRRDRARTVSAVSRSLERAGLAPLSWHRIYSLGPFPLVRGVVASAQPSARLREAQVDLRGRGVGPA
jgi:ubiquinone/menaquinone biosynthesis C-methylase UbiE